MSADAKLSIILAASDQSKQAFSQLKNNLSGLSNHVLSIKGMLASLGLGVGLGAMSKAVLDTAASFETLELRLDTISKGKGAETLALIDAAVKGMPVDVAKASDSWIMMQAMGLTPTVDKLRTLVDVSSILGEEAMPRVARALGQMATLGKVSAEELNQLSEVGINARKYLAESFGGTVEDLQRASVDIQQVIEVIWRGLDADYAGGAKRAMGSWSGMIKNFSKQWQTLEREIAAAGVFDAMKDGLQAVNQGMADWLKTNQAFIRQDLPQYMREIVSGVKSVAEAFSLRSIGSTFAEGAGLAKSGLIDWDKFVAQSFTDRQKAVDRIKAMMANTANDIQEAYRLGLTPREPLASPADLEALKTPVKLLLDITKKDVARIQEATKSIWDGWSVRPGYSEAERSDQNRHDEWRREWADYGQRPSQESESVLSDQKAWEDWKKNGERVFSGMVELSQRTADAMEQNFSDLFFDMWSGELKSLEDYFKAFTDSIGRMFADLMGQFAKQAIFGALGGGGGGGGLFGGLFGGGGGPELLGQYASGGVFGPGGIERFARGGVVSQPSLFKFARGVGMMGEAGPEAILPLTRMPSGNLGVAAAGAAGGGNVNISINNNSNEKAQVTRDQRVGGERQIEIMIGAMVTNGGPVAKAMNSAFGARRIGKLV